MKTDNTMHYKGYSAKPEYSVGDKLFYGKILGIDDLVDFCAETAQDVESEFRAAVDDYLAFCEEIGKEPKKEYSGIINVRISPELHQRLSLIAQAKGVPLNQVIEQAISAYV